MYACQHLARRLDYILWWSRRTFSLLTSLPHVMSGMPFLATTTFCTSAKVTHCTSVHARAKVRSHTSTKVTRSSALATQVLKSTMYLLVLYPASS